MDNWERNQSPFLLIHLDAKIIQQHLSFRNQFLKVIVDQFLFRQVHIWVVVGVRVLQSQGQQVFDW